MVETGSDHDELVDVREIDGEPFQRITSALTDLDDGETLLLINSFEPVPLYDILEDRGFAYESTQVEDDEWRIVIEHR